MSNNDRIIQPPRIVIERPVQVERERPPVRGANFQTVIQSQVTQQATQQQTSTREEARERETRERDDGRSTERRGKQRESRTESRGSGVRGEARSMSGLHARVEAKQEGGREGRQEQQQSHQQGRQGQQGRGFGERTREAASTKTAKAKLDVQVASVRSFAQQLKGTQPLTELPKTLTSAQVQHLANQLIATLRKGQTTLGADVLLVGFAAHVFSGLRLELTAKDGRVTIKWISGNAEVRKLFSRERERICGALAKKSVAVARYDVEGVD